MVRLSVRFDGADTGRTARNVDQDGAGRVLAVAERAGLAGPPICPGNQAPVDGDRRDVAHRGASADGQEEEQQERLKDEAYHAHHGA
jgi:hypothetical protein